MSRQAWVDPAPTGLPVSSRDVAVLAQLAAGRSTAQICRSLYYCERQIKEIIRALHQQTDTSSRAALVAVALRREWIT